MELPVHVGLDFPKHSQWFFGEIAPSVRFLESCDDRNPGTGHRVPSGIRHPAADGQHLLVVGCRTCPPVRALPRGGGLIFRLGGRRRFIATTACRQDPWPEESGPENE